MQRPFVQVDVFGSTAYRGNPLAVVLDAGGLSDDEMQHFANWTNLSETTFVLGPTDPEADYRVRIFTGSEELPFAGHPTLGTAHAWRNHGGSPRGVGRVVQECAAGLITIRTDGDSLAFSAPPMLRSGPASDELVAELAEVLRIDRAAIRRAEWVDNGPGWVAVMLDSADAVLAVRPGPTDHKIGLVGPHPPGAPEAFEVRGFFPSGGHTMEDPVTGSLNASIGQWLIGAGLADRSYFARQGTVLGRAGRVHISSDEQGEVWVGGRVVTCIAGHVDL